MRPQFREMLKTLKPGDQVTLTYFEAVAVKRSAGVATEVWPGGGCEDKLAMAMALSSRANMKTIRPARASGTKV